MIPYSLGGGKPLNVVFVPGEKKLPDEIALDKTGRSVPLKLLAGTDKYYVILPNTSGELSIELNREYVAETIVIAEE